MANSPIAKIMSGGGGASGSGADASKPARRGSGPGGGGQGIRGGGGVFLNLGDSAIEFPVTYGTEPAERIFMLTRERADEVLKLTGQPASLIIGDQTYDQMWILHGTPGKDNLTRGVRIADRRWLWRRYLIEKSYNIVRRTGDIRLQGENNPFQVKKVVPDVEFAPWSLNKGKPWTPIDAIQDIFRQMGIDPRAEVTGYDSIKKRNLEIKNLETNGMRGSDALAYVLDYIAGLAIYVAPNGIITFTDTIDPKVTADIIRKAPPPWDGTGWVEVVNKEGIRPIGVDVHFECEHELRTDYDDDEDYGSSTTRDREEPISENVIRNPDPTLTIPENAVPGRKARTVSQGTWITFDEFIEGVNAKGDGVGYETRLSQKKIRHYFSWPQNFFGAYAGDESTGTMDLTWQRRIAAILAHWRQSFRLLPRWVDRIRSMRGYRLANIDEETGIRGPADCFMGYTTIHTFRGLFIKKIAALNPDAGEFKNDFKDSLSNSDPSSPASVTVIDQDQGIYRLSLSVGPEGFERRFFPGEPEEMPKVAPGAAAAARAGSVHLVEEMSFRGGWQVATIFSVHRASPNSRDRLLKVERNHEHAQKILGVPVKPGLAPRYQVKIEASPLTMARFMWADSYASDIKDMFWEGRQLSLESDLLINKKTIEALANAAAARVYAGYLDRHEGGFTTSQVPGAVPGGGVAQVNHGIAQDGTAFTSWTVPAVIEVGDLFAYLPPSVRRTIQMMAQP